MTALKELAIAPVDLTTTAIKTTTTALEVSGELARAVGESAKAVSSFSSLAVDLFGAGTDVAKTTATTVGEVAKGAVGVGKIVAAPVKTFMEKRQHKATMKKKENEIALSAINSISEELTKIQSNVELKRAELNAKVESGGINRDVAKEQLAQYLKETRIEDQMNKAFQNRQKMMEKIESDYQKELGSDDLENTKELKESMDQENQRQLEELETAGGAVDESMNGAFSALKRKLQELKGSESVEPPISEGGGHHHKKSKKRRKTPKKKRSIKKRRNTHKKKRSSKRRRKKTNRKKKAKKN